MDTQVINSSSGKSARAYRDGLLSKGDKIKNFTIESKIDSSSGEAEIYKCKNENGETFVLKYYYTKKPNSDNQDILVKYHHEDILSLIDYGEANDLFYEVSEYAAGGSLADKLPNGKYKYLPVNYETCNKILGEVTNAFNTFHSDGIIHRDIKPENLFYRNEDGTDIVVGDFGISSTVLDGETKHLTQTTNSGTVGFIAPEVSSGIIGKEIDYYALGITVWVLLTGEEPFLNDKGDIMNDGQILLDGFQGKTIEKLLSRVPEMDERYKNLIRGLLTVRHDKRWGYNEVQEFLSGKDPVVFEERFCKEPFKFDDNKTCYTLDEISDALLADKDAAVTVIFGDGQQPVGELPYYLRDNCSSEILHKIENLVDEYSLKGKKKEGVAHIAYALCPGRDFYLGEWGNSETVSSVKDMIDILNSNPNLMMQHLMNENDDFYAYLDAAGLSEIGEKVKSIAKENDDPFMLKNRIIVALTGNRIKPFSDGVNDDVELVQMEHLFNLPDYLKERIMMMIYKKDSSLCAWIDNSSEYRISKFLEAVNAFPVNIVPGWGSYKTFEEYLSGKNIIEYVLNNPSVDILSLVQNLHDQKKFDIMNFVIESTWEGILNDNSGYSKYVKFDKAIKLLKHIRMDHQKNLNHDFSFYKAIIASCYNHMAVRGTGKPSKLDCDLTGHFVPGQYYDTVIAEDAAAYYDDAITLGEESGRCESWYYLESGNLAYYCGNYDKARELYKKALEFEPNNKWHWNKLGLIFTALGEHKQAVSAFETAIEKGADNGIYENLADAYERLNPPLYDKSNEIRKRLKQDLFQW